jgi:hypothetical protein
MERHCQRDTMSGLPATIDGALPARLYRLRGIDVSDAVAEEIGSGTFGKMVRIALTDPDQELWRYSVAVGGVILTGDQITRYNPSNAGNG